MNMIHGKLDAKKLWDHSPLKYVDDARTPTLFLHSDEDYRCPIPEATQMMQAMTVRGIETRMIVFHGENHDLSRGGKPMLPPNQLIYGINCNTDSSVHVMVLNDPKMNSDADSISLASAPHFFHASHLDANHPHSYHHHICSCMLYLSICESAFA